MLQKSSANKGNPAEDLVFHVQLRKNLVLQQCLIQAITIKVIFIAFFPFLPKFVPKILPSFTLFCVFLQFFAKKFGNLKKKQYLCGLK